MYFLIQNSFLCITAGRSARCITYELFSGDVSYFLFEFELFPLSMCSVFSLKNVGKKTNVKNVSLSLWETFSLEFSPLCGKLNEISGQTVISREVKELLDFWHFVVRELEATE